MTDDPVVSPVTKQSGGNLEYNNRSYVSMKRVCLIAFIAVTGGGFIGYSAGILTTQNTLVEVANKDFVIKAKPTHFTPEDSCMLNSRMGRAGVTDEPLIPVNNFAECLSALKLKGEYKSPTVVVPVRWLLNRSPKI